MRRQEWINNILKYSGATLIEVQLVGYEDEVAVTVEDNGRGFDISILQNSAGNGWKNIKSRLNLVHGTIDIDSVMGRNNTTLIIKMPLQLISNGRALTVATNTQ